MLVSIVVPPNSRTVEPPNASLSCRTAEQPNSRTAERSSLHWYVLWTKSHSEQQVCDQLAPQGFELFLPMMDVWSRRGGIRRHASVPMFPGYLFLHDPMDKTSYLAVRKATGLVKLLGESWDRLAVVPDREVEAIQKVHDARVAVLPHPYLREGQRVRITAGLLAGAEGILLRSRANKGLLVISVHLLQQSVAVEIDATLVEPA
jgi:transcription antitermination factor NusG